MPATILVGTQWGDEGKGKMIDSLAEEYDAGVRFQGGPNAGHTTVVEYEGEPVSHTVEYITHQIPTTIIRNKLSIIGRGTVLDVYSLWQEIDELQEQLKPLDITINENNLNIDEAASLIMPWHILEDVLGDMLKGKAKIGSTSRGIGPTYTDRYSRNGLRTVDLLIDEKIADSIKTKTDIKNLKIKRMIEDLNKIREDSNKTEIMLKPICLEEIIEELEEKSGKDIKQFCNKKDFAFDSGKIANFYILNLMDKFAPYIKDTSLMVNNMLKEEKDILFEGAQGFALSIVYGTYPYVTSSNPVASTAMSEIGVDHKYVERIIGIAKAYTTRVGAGPSCGELADNKKLSKEVAEYRKKHGEKAVPVLSDNEKKMVLTKDDYPYYRDYCYALGKALMIWGKEFGATTGRPRRCKWFEAPLVRRAVEVSGINELVLTKLDVLDKLPNIKIIMAYKYTGPDNRYIKLKGKVFHDFPVSTDIYANCEPIYEDLPGWQTDTSQITSDTDLPPAAQNYIKRIEELVGCEISTISVGRKRRQTLKHKMVV